MNKNTGAHMGTSLRIVPNLPHQPTPDHHETILSEMAEVGGSAIAHDLRMGSLLLSIGAHNRDSLPTNWYNADDMATQEGLQSPSNESIPRLSVVEWVAEQDEAIAEALRDALDKRPDAFASDEEQMDYAIQLAELNGQRKLLDAAAVRLAEVEQT